MSGVGGGAYPGKMALVGDLVGGLNTGTLEAVLPALTLKPHNSVFSLITLQLP